MSLGAAFPGRLARVTRNGYFWSVADQGLFALSNFLLTFALSLYFPPATFGVFVLLYSVYLLFVPFHSALLTEPMLVYDRLSSVGNGQYLFFLGLLHALFSVLASVLIVVVMVVVPMQGVGVSEIVTLAAANFGLLGLGLLRRVCYSLSRQAVAAGAGFLYLLISVVTLLMVQGWGSLSVVTALVTLFVNSVLTCIVVVQSLSLKFEITPRKVFAEHLRTHLNYGRWSALSAVFVWLPANVAFAVFAGLGDSAGAAGTRVAFNLIMPVQQALFGVSASLVSILARMQNQAQRDRTLLKLLKVCGGGAAVYGVVIAIFGPLVLELVYGHRYTFPGWSLAVLAFSPVFSAVYQVSVASVRATNSPRAIFLNSVGIGCVSVALTVPLVMSLGETGAIVAFTLASAYSAVMTVRLHTQVRSCLT